MIRAIAIMLLLAGTATNTHAQQCASGNQTFAEARMSRAAYASGIDANGWVLQAGLGHGFGPVTANVNYRLYTAGDYQTHTVGGGLGVAIPSGARPCLSAHALGTFGALDRADDSFSNFTLPVSLTFQAALAGERITPYIGGRFAYSASTGRLLDFDVQEQATGFGLIGGFIFKQNSWALRADMETSSLPASVGPQPLPRWQAGLSIGRYF